MYNYAHNLWLDTVGTSLVVSFRFEPGLLLDPALIDDPIKVLIEDSVLGPRLELGLQLDPGLTDDLIKVLIVIGPSTVRV